VRTSSEVGHRLEDPCRLSRENWQPGYDALVNRMNESTQARSYLIRIQGHLDPRWSEWFDNMTIAQKPDGTTTIKGAVTDRASLYGILNKLRDMGLTLLSVELLTSQEDWASRSDRAGPAEPGAGPDTQETFRR